MFVLLMRVHEKGEETNAVDADVFAEHFLVLFDVAL